MYVQEKGQTEWKYLSRPLEFRYKDRFMGFDSGYALNHANPGEGCLQVKLQLKYDNDAQLDQKLGDAGWREHTRGDENQSHGDLKPGKNWRVYRHDNVLMVKPVCIR